MLQSVKVVVVAITIGLLWEFDITRFLRSFQVHTNGVVLISGASSGIGFDVARELGASGWTVLAGVRNEAGATKVGSLPGVTPVYLDVTNDTQITKAVAFAAATAEKQSIKFVGVVNNAGYGDDLPIEFLTRKRMAEVFNSNLFGSVALTAAAMPHLRANKGRVIAVTSFSALTAPPGMQPYVASKAAMRSFFDSLRREVTSFGVSVSIVEPGCIKTSFFNDKFFEKDNTHFLSTQEKIILDEVYTEMESIREDTIRRCAKHGDEPSVSTTPDIVHALTHASPHLHYYPGSFNKLPSWLLMLLTQLPSAVVDITMAEKFPSWIP
eukprot:m.11249 g.11249  ORF g.11249 m.11249 type:complete len:324 (+) comp8725_c0_seq1:179-1150(+)